MLETYTMKVEAIPLTRENRFDIINMLVEHGIKYTLSFEGDKPEITIDHVKAKLGDYIAKHGKAFYVVSRDIFMRMYVKER